MKVLFRIIGYILLVAFLALNIHQFINVVLIIVHDWKPYMWVAIGMGAYLILGAIFRKNKEWFQTFSHELTHTIVGLLFFRKIHSFAAGEGEGAISHSGRYNKNIFISLAPYCLPIYTFAVLLIRLIGDPNSFHIFDIFVGFTLMFHLQTFWKQMGPWQTDLQKFGMFLSYFFILTFLLFNLNITFFTVDTDVITAVKNLFLDYWKDLNIAWDWVSTLVGSWMAK